MLNFSPPTAAPPQRHGARARALVAVATLLLVAGCARAAATRAPADDPPAPTPERLADTVWYISARARDKGQDTRRLADSLEYGIAVHGYRGRADPLTGSLAMTLLDSMQVTRDAFLRGVRLASLPDSTRGDFALLYVHGYGTSLHECWQHASESRIRSRAGAPWVAFCWPSRGSGIARPSRGAVLDGGYVQDSVAAAASAPAFSRAADSMLEALPASRLLFVGHSMGAQLLGAALSESTGLRSRLLAEPARAVAFISADIAATHFIDSVVPAVQPLATRVVTYMSGRDRMLALSRQRSGVPRAGQRPRGPHTPAVAVVETIDATDGLVAENRFQGFFGTHHAIRRASAVVFDLLHVIGAGRAAGCRTFIGTGVQGADGVWTLTPARPDVAAAARCGEPSR